LNVTICDTAAELPARLSFGHSAAEYAVELGRRADVGQVLLFHHDPSRTDDALDAMVADLAGAGAGVGVGAAREGAVVAVCDRATDSLRS
jgi:hypothetical protein